MVGGALHCLPDAVQSKGNYIAIATRKIYLPARLSRIPLNSNHSPLLRPSDLWFKRCNTGMQLKKVQSLWRTAMRKCRRSWV